jgi:hypothetical protein
MMELEEFKAIWQSNETQFERTLRLNAELIEERRLCESGRPLRRLTAAVSLEAGFNLVAVLLIGSFAADHVREPRFFVPALLLGAYAIAIFAANVRQIVDLRAIDFAQPVVTIARRLEKLRLHRIRTTLATLLFAPLMWAPLAIVATRGFFGIDLYAVAGPRWLTANGLFGLAVIPAAIFVARRFGPRLRESSLGRALADEIAGRSLAAALDDLAAIGRFAEDGVSGK